MFEVGSGSESGKPQDVDLRTPKGKKGKKTTVGKAETAGKKNAAAGVPGRKDQGGQEATIELGELRKRAQELQALYRKKQDATEAYNLGIKAVAEASGLMSVVVGKFIKSRADSKFIAKRREATQLALVFDEIGE